MSLQNLALIENNFQQRYLGLCVAFIILPFRIPNLLREYCKYVVQG